MEPNKKKIIDLGILETDEVSGVKKISLVEEPAIMLDFHYFNEQKVEKFVYPSAGESEDEFIGRCIPYVINEGKDQATATAICYSYWENSKEERMNIDVSGLPQYVDQVPKKKKDIVTRAILAQSECDNSWTKDDYIVDTIIAVAKEIGTKEEDLGKLFQMEFAQPITPGTNPAEASQARDRELILYKYIGRIGADSRSFCRQMVQADLYYTKEQIQSFDSLIANPGFGRNGTQAYSLFKYKGGPNCKHKWNDFLVKSTKDGKISIQDLGSAAGNAGIKPFDMPKRGYYSKNATTFSFAAEEQQILVGPAMVPDMKILRVDENGQRYFVKFSPETIKEIALKYFKEGRVHELNTDHEENTAGAYIFESWLVETEDDKANTLYGYNVPVGTWMISVKVEDPETWRRVKAGELRGFSIEGILVDLEELESFKTYERIKKILGTDI